MQRDVGRQIERRREIFLQRTRGDDGRIHRAVGIDRRAELRGLVGDLHGGARRRPLIEHGDREVRQARHVGRIRIAAALDDEIGRGDGQATARAEDQRQTVGELRGLGHGHLQRLRGTRLRRPVAPRLVGVDRLAPLACRGARRSGRRHLRRHHGIALHRVDDRARVRLQVVARERRHRRGRHRAIPFDVLLQVVRRLQEMVVRIQHVRDAVHVFETRDRPRLDRVARLIDFALLDGLRPQRLELLVDRLLELLGGVPRTRGRIDLELRAEHQRLLIRVDVLRDLLLVHQLLIQPARAAAAENLRGDIRLGIARLEDVRRQPRHVDARQLDAIGDDLPPFHRDLRCLHVDRRHRGAALQRTEILLDELLRLRGIEVADDGDARVVRRVVAPEELARIGQTRRLNVRMRSDDGGVVGMRLRIEQVDQLLFRVSVRTVLHRLAPLVADHILLVGELLRIDRVEEIPHAIRFDPERQLEPVGGNRLEVVRPVVVRRAVDVGRARRFEHLEVRVLRRVLRPLEHQVFEQMCEARASLHFVGRADVIPEIHRDNRQPVILAEDDLEPVRKRVLLELNLRHVGRRAACPERSRGVLRRGRNDGGDERDERRGEETGRDASCLHGQSFVGSLLRLAHKYQHATDR